MIDRGWTHWVLRLGMLTCFGIGSPACAQVQALPANPPERPGLAFPDDDEQRTHVVLMHLRGLIQNELDVIQELCSLTEPQRQNLVDTAEREWRRRLLTTVKAFAQGNPLSAGFDLEGRVERVVGNWVENLLDAEHVKRWQAELAHRRELKQRIVSGRIASETEQRLGLTADQKVELMKILRDRWRDSWWTMYRNGTLPEAKFAWISSILNEAQRTGGWERIQDRNQIPTEPRSSLKSVSLPVKGLRERFEIDGISSDPSISLDESSLMEFESENGAETKPPEDRNDGPH